MAFKLHQPFAPSGDQPQAISDLVTGLNQGLTDQILLGVTGSGKTFSMANIIATVNKPTLIIAHNKTLAGQLCNEFKTFFPDNAVEFFISYYDYYQPEAYIASRDTYIEKEAQINQEIEKHRHSATRSLLSRKDVIIVASVSCIYGLGMPEDYCKAVLRIEQGKCYTRKTLLLALERIQYDRNDIELSPGTYRVKGDTLDIYPSWDSILFRIGFFGDECETIEVLDPLNYHCISNETHIDIFPATHYVVNDNIPQAIRAIKTELHEHRAALLNNNRQIEAQRIEKRTNFDVEMIEEMGYCKGIENYARHLANRPAGAPPGVLLDFFPDDFLTFIDESHVTIPQINGMYNGDQSRKEALIDYGFRLPSAKDNRPLTFSEFKNKTNACIYVSATPGPYELSITAKTPQETPPTGLSLDWTQYHCSQQLIRPTGLLDPVIEVLPTCGQIDSIIAKARQRIKNQERVLITTTTKAMSEELCDFFKQHNFKCQYIHSDIKALDRLTILNNLRLGRCDILVGVNLLREGLDLPEVSLVIILDADKEGFLRNERSLIQTIGRAARNANGTVIMYADRLSPSMKYAIAETKRRRAIQNRYNQSHNITPKTVIKALPNTQALAPAKKAQQDTTQLSLQALEDNMIQAAENLDFELAIELREQLHARSKKKT